MPKALLIEPLKLKQERLNQKLQALQNINEKIFKLEKWLMTSEECSKIIWYGVAKRKKGCFFLSNPFLIGVLFRSVPRAGIEPARFPTSV